MKIISAVAERKTTRYVLLMWTIDPFIRGQVFSVYRAINDGADMKKVAEGTATSFLDTHSDIMDNDLAVYEIMTEHNGNDISSGRIAINSIGDNYLLGLASEYLWQLETISQGVPSYAFCRTSLGTKCPECYDSVAKKIIKSDCDTCDGSGVITGYKGPVNFYMGYGIERRDVRIIDNIEKEVTMINGWTGNIPVLSRGDVIVRDSLKRYVVEEIPRYVRLVSRKNGEQFVVRQDMVLKELSRPDMAFNLEITNG